MQVNPPPAGIDFGMVVEWKRCRVGIGATSFFLDPDRVQYVIVVGLKGTAMPTDDRESEMQKQRGKRWSVSQQRIVDVDILGDRRCAFPRTRSYQFDQRSALWNWFRGWSFGESRVRELSKMRVIVKSKGLKRFNERQYPKEWGRYNWEMTAIIYSDDEKSEDSMFALTLQ